jgi:hypothetical protein
MKRFIATVKPSKDKKCLAVLDGYLTHGKNLEAIEFARESSILLLSIPALTTNRLQPLHGGCFKPLSACIYQACGKWMRTHPGRNISQFQVSHLLLEEYRRTARVGTTMNFFVRSESWSFDPYIIQESDFVPSAPK